jgi:hypothetical protein
MVETARASIRCPVCGVTVNLATRDRRANPDDPRQPYYITTDGRHEIQNFTVVGRVYPDPLITRCGAPGI